jgi:hypothetical protein
MKSSIYEIISNLSQQILTAYPAFNVGYSYAKSDLQRGLILSRDGSKYIGFSDGEGNYFYIRVNDDISILQSKATTFSDCGAGIVEVYSCVLVAMMANSFAPAAVKDALLNEIMKAGHFVKKASIDPVNIIRTELKGLDKKKQDSAISKFDRFITVRLEFEAQRPYATSKCKIDLCNKC